MTTLVQISGNTWPIREKLKALGGKWCPEDCAWIVPQEKADEALALVVAAGPRPVYEGARTVPRPAGTYPVKAENKEGAKVDDAGWNTEDADKPLVIPKTAIVPRVDPLPLAKEGKRRTKPCAKCGKAIAERFTLCRSCERVRFTKEL